MIAQFWATEGVGGDGNETHFVIASSFQLTYDMLRDDQDHTIATLNGGAWVTPDGRVWSDVTFSTNKEGA